MDASKNEIAKRDDELTIIIIIIIIIITNIYTG